MKKGFTLIELLAVIVILAIIALIATPIVLNIIKDTKESAMLRSADFYIDAVETTIATSVLKNILISDGIYSITKDGNVCMGTYDAPKDTCTGTELKVEVDGQKPTSGTITITNGQIGDILLNLSDKVIVKNNKGELVLSGSQETSVCKLINDADNSNTITPGDKYQCKVKDNLETGFENGYYFYVLSQEEDGTTNLIMDRNINSDGTPATKAILESDKASNGGIYNLVTWISLSDYYTDNGGVIPDDVLYDGEACETENICIYNDKGPITAMNFLNSATSTWENIPNLDITYKERNLSFEVTGRARLPYYSEMTREGNCLTYEDDGDISYGSCQQWLSNYLHSSSYVTGEELKNISGIYGYWTFSSASVDAGFFGYAWGLDYSGCLDGNLVDTDKKNGIRPVINLKL